MALIDTSGWVLPLLDDELATSTTVIFLVKFANLDNTVASACGLAVAPHFH